MAANPHIPRRWCVVRRSGLFISHRGELIQSENGSESFSNTGKLKGSLGGSFSKHPWGERVGFSKEGWDWDEKRGGLV